MSLKDVADGLHSGVGLIEGGAGSPDMVINEYSAGYNDNGIALRIDLERDRHTAHRQPCHSVHSFEEEISPQRCGRLTDVESE